MIIDIGMTITPITNNVIRLHSGILPESSTMRFPLIAKNVPNNFYNRIFELLHSAVIHDNIIMIRHRVLNITPAIILKRAVISH